MILAPRFDRRRDKLGEAGSAPPRRPTSLVATHGIAKHGRSYARTVASRHLRRDTGLIASGKEETITDGIPFPSDGRDRIDSVSIPSSPVWRLEGCYPLIETPPDPGGIRWYL